MSTVKLGEVFNSLFKKAGGQDDAIKMLLADPAMQVDIDSTIADTLNSGLMNEAAALNNKKIVDTLVPKGRAEAYDKTDATLNEVLELLDEEDRNSIKALKFTNDRVGGLKGAITKLKEAQKGKDKADTAVYQKQIDELNAQLKAEKTAKAEFEARTKEQYENDSIDQHIIQKGYGKNWALPTDTEDKKLFAAKVALAKIKDDITANGYKLVRENGILALKTNDGLNVTDKNHNQVNFDQFYDGAVSALIAPTKTDPAPKPPGGGGNNNSLQNMDSMKAAMSEMANSM